MAFHAAGVLATSRNSDVKLRGGEGRGGEGRGGEGRSGQVRSGQGRAGQVRSGQDRAGQVRLLRRDEFQKDVLDVPRSRCETEVMHGKLRSDQVVRCDISFSCGTNNIRYSTASHDVGDTHDVTKST